jgi:dolichyl-phosphate-mannose--protein O-mannosyl transferase
LPNPFNDSFEPHIHLLPSAFYWYFAVIIIVIVHIIAVILAHRHLGAATPNINRARRSEYPWIVAMIAYTMFSLWLLAQPLVKEKAPAKESFVQPYSHIQLEG